MQIFILYVNTTRIDLLFHRVYHLNFTRSPRILVSNEVHRDVRAPAPLFAAVTNLITMRHRLHN